MSQRASLVILLVSLVASQPVRAAVGSDSPDYQLNLSNVVPGTCLTERTPLKAAGLLAVFNGYGSQCVNAEHELVQNPARPLDASDSHAALSVTLASFDDDFNVVARFTTVAQLRPLPNNWEVGWVLLDYVNNDHFYGVILKPAGWEIEKEWCNSRASPCQAEQFLATGNAPSVPVGTVIQLNIRQSIVAGALKLSVSYSTDDGRLVKLATVTDTGSISPPYLSGQVGLYDEEATVAWRSLSVAG